MVNIKIVVFAILGFVAMLGLVQSCASTPTGTTQPAEATSQDYPPVVGDFSAERPNPIPGDTGAIVPDGAGLLPGDYEAGYGTTPKAWVFLTEGQRLVVHAPGFDVELVYRGGVLVSQSECHTEGEVGDRLICSSVHVLDLIHDQPGAYRLGMYPATHWAR